jgi:hypothetical protein
VEISEQRAIRPFHRIPDSSGIQVNAQHVGGIVGPSTRPYVLRCRFTLEIAAKYLGHVRRNWLHGRLAVLGMLGAEDEGRRVVGAEDDGKGQTPSAICALCSKAKRASGMPSGATPPPENYRHERRSPERDIQPGSDMRILRRSPPLLDQALSSEKPDKKMEMIFHGKTPRMARRIAEYPIIPLIRRF